jgi:hypothetical protein
MHRVKKMEKIFRFESMVLNISSEFPRSWLINDEQQLLFIYYCWATFNYWSNYWFIREFAMTCGHPWKDFLLFFHVIFVRRFWIPQVGEFVRNSWRNSPNCGRGFSEIQSVKDQSTIGQQWKSKISCTNANSRKIHYLKSIYLESPIDTRAKIARYNERDVQLAKRTSAREKKKDGRRLAMMMVDLAFVSRTNRGGF